MADKKRKKLMASALSLHFIGSAALIGSLIAWNVSSKNHESLEQKALKITISNIQPKTEIFQNIKGFEDDYNVLNSTIVEAQNVANSKNKEEVYKTTRENLQNLYDQLNNKALEMQRNNLEKANSDLIDLISSEFNDEKYKEIANELKQVVRETNNVLVNQGSTLEDLISSENKIKDAINKATKDKNDLGNQQKNNELQNKISNLKDKLNQIKSNELKDYLLIKDEELKVILSPLDEFVKNLEANINEIKNVEDLNKKENELNDLLLNTQLNKNNYEIEKNDVIQKYLDVLNSINNFNNELSGEKYPNIKAVIDVYIKTLPKENDLEILGISSIKNKTEEIIQTIKNTQNNIANIEQKRQELKALYDDIISNELNEFDNYPEIKNELENVLANAIDSYTKIENIEEIDSRIQSLNNALNKAKVDKEAADNKALKEFEEAKKILKEKLNEIKNNDLNGFETLQNEELKAILDPINSLTSSLETEVDQISSTQELKDKLAELNTSFNKTKNNIIEKYNEALNDITTYNKELLGEDFPEIKNELNNYILALPNGEMLDNLNLTEIANKIQDINKTLEATKNKVNNINLKREELKNLYDSINTNELSKFDNYPQIKEKLENALANAIDSYTKIENIEELNIRINGLNEALQKSKNDKDAEDIKRLQEFENAKQNLKDRLNTIRQNDLNGYEYMRDSELKVILNPLDNLVSSLETEIDLIKTTQEFKDKLVELNTLFDKVKNNENAYKKAKSEAITDYLLALKTISDFNNNLSNNEYPNIKPELHFYVSTLPNENDLNNISVSEINDKTKEMIQTYQGAKTNVENIKLKREELKSLYDSINSNELSKFDNYPSIKDELERALEDAINSYEQIDNVEILNNRINHLSNALDKAKTDKNKQEKLDELNTLLLQIKSEDLKDFDSIPNEELKNIIQPLNQLVSQIETNKNTYSLQEIEAKIIELGNLRTEVNKNKEEFWKRREPKINEYLAAKNAATELANSLNDPEWNELKSNLETVLNNEPAEKDIIYYTITDIDAHIEILNNAIKSAQNTKKEVLAKQDELKKQYDNVITNEVNKYFSVPSIKNELEQALNDAINNYQIDTNISNLESRIEKINNALDKAKNDLLDYEKEQLDWRIKDIEANNEFANHNSLATLKQQLDSLITNSKDVLNNNPTQSFATLNTLNTKYDELVVQAQTTIKNEINKLKNSLTNTIYLNSLDPSVSTYLKGVTANISTDNKNLPELIQILKKLEEAQNKAIAVQKVYEVKKSSQQDLDTLLGTNERYNTTKTLYAKQIDSIIKTISFDNSLDDITAISKKAIEDIKDATEFHKIEKYQLDFGYLSMEYISNNTVDNDFYEYPELNTELQNIKDAFDIRINPDNALEELKSALQNIESTLNDSYWKLLKALIAKVKAENLNYTLYPELKTTLNKAETLKQNSIHSQIKEQYVQLNKVFNNALLEEQRRQEAITTINKTMLLVQPLSDELLQAPNYNEIRTTLNTKKTAVENTLKNINNLNSTQINEQNTILNNAIESAKQAKIDKYNEVIAKYNETIQKFNELSNEHVRLANEKWETNRNYSSGYTSLLRENAVTMSFQASPIESYMMSSDNVDIFTTYGYTKTLEFMIQYMEWWNIIGTVQDQDDFANPEKYAILNDLVNTFYNRDTTQGWRDSVFLRRATTTTNIRYNNNTDIVRGYGYQRDIYSESTTRSMAQRDASNEQLWYSNGLIYMMQNATKVMLKLFDEHKIENLATPEVKIQYKNDLFNILERAAKDSGQFVKNRWYSTKYSTQLLNFINTNNVDVSDI